MANQNQKLLQEIIKQSSDPDLIKKAYRFAEEAHRGQKRQSGEDYIIHPLYTAYYLSELKLSPTTVAAGLLHDVVDDTPITQKQIKKEFGKDIAFLVEGVSKLGKIKYRGVERYIENLRKVFFAMAKDIRVILIKLCDRLHNLQTLKYLPPEKAKRIAIETLDIYAPICFRLGMREMTGRLEDAAFPFAYPNEYKQLLEQVKEKYEERKKYLRKVQPIVLKQLKKHGIQPIAVDHRSKHYWSLYKKLQRYDNDLSKIYDLVAMRIIVKNVEDCYKTIGVIHELWNPLLGRIKDYIATPKTNGYRSLHTTVFCVGGKITEFQIRTLEMHKEAEYGIAAHWYYSEQKGLKAYIKRLITKPPEKEHRWIAQLGEYQEKTRGLSPDKYLESLKLDFFRNRIFVFTPRGDVIDLPEGATPVDFAYAIHTEIGDHCNQAKVDGKITALDRELKNGEMVEIIVDKNRKPSRDWLNFVKTNLARYRIKNCFKEEIKIDKKEILVKALSSLPKIRKKTSSQTLDGALKTKSITGDISSAQTPEQKQALECSALQLEAKPIKLKPQKSAKVSLAGQTGIMINLAKCCSPKNGDKIIGYITKNRIATIHKTDCRNLKRIRERWPQKIVKANWKKEK